MIAKILDWLKKNKYRKYIVLLGLLMILASYKYDFVTALIGTIVIAIIGILGGVLINLFRK